MALTTNYPGDVEHIVGEIKGPDTAGGYVRAATAVYDPGTDQTRVEFKPIVAPAEVADILDRAAQSEHLPTIAAALEYVAQAGPVDA